MKVTCIRPVAISLDGINVKHYKTGDKFQLRQDLGERLIAAGYLKESAAKLTKVQSRAPEVSIVKKGQTREL